MCKYEKNKNVWFVNRDLPPVFSGAGKNDALMATLLSDFGFSPILVGQRKGGEGRNEKFKNVDVLRIGNFDKISGKLIWGILLFIAVVFSGDRPALVRFRGYNLGFAIAISLLKRFLPDIRLVTQPACYGTDDPETIQHKFLGGWQFAQLMKCDAIFAMNGLYSQAFITHGFSKDRIYPVRNPVTIPVELPPAGILKVRHQLGVVSAEDIVILTIGILDVRKRQGFITRAVCKAMRAGSSRQIILVHVGPNSSDLEALNRLDKVQVAMIVESEIKSAMFDCPACVRIKLLGHRNDVSELLAASDLFIHASTSEGEANVVNEAMAIGVPVIVPRHPVYSLQVNNDVSCAFESDSEDSLAAVVLDLISDNVKRNRLGKSARLHVMNTRLPENAAAYYAKLLHEIVS